MGKGGCPTKIHHCAAGSSTKIGVPEIMNKLNLHQFNKVIEGFWAPTVSHHCALYYTV